MLYASVVITDLDGVEHTITPSGMGDTDVLNVGFAHKAADDFVFKIGDKTGTVKDWLKRGCVAKIYIDTSSPPTTLKLNGMVEEVTLIQPVPDFVLLEASGREVFHVVINSRIVTETYLDTEVSAIVHDLMNSYPPYGDDTKIAMSFYENAGSIAHDESIYGNDGTLGAGAAAPTWVDGKYGKALSFDGIDDYLDTNYTFTLTDADVMAFIFWIKASPGAAGVIMGIGKSPPWLPWNRIQLNWSANKLRAYVRDDDATVAANFVGTTVVADDDWHFVVFIVDNVNNSVELYVDDSLDDSSSTVFSTITCDVNSLSLGALCPVWPPTSPLYTNFSDEIIDEFRILNRTLSTGERKSFYDHPYLHDIDVTTTTPEDIRFPYRPLRECLDELANLSGYTYRGNPNTVIIWKVEASEPSGYTYTEANIETTPEVLETLLPIKNRVYVLGGNYMQVDQEKTTHAGAPKDTNVEWYAQSFTPARSDLDQVSLYLKRTGDPANLEGEIRTDDPGNGPDEIVATFIIDKDFIGTTESWRPVTVDARLLIDEKYWIVLKKTGDGANNYQWYHDNGAAGDGEYATDADGVPPWVVHNGGEIQLTYKTHYAVPIISVASDYEHSATYKWRETVFEDKSIMSRTLARETAQTKLSNLKDMTAQIREIIIGDANGIPELGKLVTITLTNLGVSAVQYVAKEATIKFKGGEHGTFRINLRLGREASELAEWLHELKAEVDRTKVGAYGVDRGLINLVRNFSDTADATDANLVGTVQNTGTFLIDTARIDFSDIG